MINPCWDPQFVVDREERRRCAQWGLIIRSYKVARLYPDRADHQVEWTLELRGRYLDLAGYPSRAFALAFIKWLAFVVSLDPFPGEMDVLRDLYRDYKSGTMPTQKEGAA